MLIDISFFYSMTNKLLICIPIDVCSIPKQKKKESCFFTKFSRRINVIRFKFKLVIFKRDLVLRCDWFVRCVSPRFSATSVSHQRLAVHTSCRVPTTLSTLHFLRDTHWIQSSAISMSASTMLCSPCKRVNHRKGCGRVSELVQRRKNLR